MVALLEANIVGDIDDSPRAGDALSKVHVHSRRAAALLALICKFLVIRRSFVVPCVSAPSFKMLKNAILLLVKIPVL